MIAPIKLGRDPGACVAIAFFSIMAMLTVNERF
jgi:hypothetical protein